MTKSQNILLVGLIVGFVLLTKFSWLGYATQYWADEGLNVPTANVYMETGHITPDAWYHPPLKHISLAYSMRLFGNSPVGWRLRNALIGSLSILFIYSLGRRLTNDDRGGIIAAVLLATDPLYTSMSRETSEEIIAAFFLIVFIYCIIVYLMADGVLWLIASGICMGCALATKWYCIAIILWIPIFVLYIRAKHRPLELSDIVLVLLNYACIPLTIYMLSYLPWFARGYSIAEFWTMQLDSIRELLNLQRASFPQIGRADLGAPIYWFLKPLLTYMGSEQVTQGSERFNLLMNNMPILWLTIPAMIYMIYRALREPSLSKSMPLWLNVFIVLSLYTPMLLSSRPIFLYSLAALLPSVYLLISYLLINLPSIRSMSSKVFIIHITALLLWGGYLFPFVSNLPVLSSLYRPFVSLMIRE